MKLKKKERIIIQKCIPATTILQFLEDLPYQIQILYLKFDANQKWRDKRLISPKYVNNMGNAIISESAPKLRIRGVLNKNISRKKIKTYIERLSKSYSIPIDKFRVVGVTLSNGEETLYLKQMIKQIEGKDRRTKLKVLGAVNKNGKVWNDAKSNLLDEMNADKIICKIMLEKKYIVTCSKLKNDDYLLTRSIK